MLSRPATLRASCPLNSAKLSRCTMAAASSEQSRRCLICDDPAAEMHLGINCCRACFVFYKRTRAHKETLQCKAGDGECFSKNTKTTCRKCRFDRFSSILNTCAATDEMRTESINSSEKSTDSDDSMQQPSITSFVDHSSFCSDEPTISKTPLLNKIRKGYSLMCMFRKYGELAAKPEGKCHGEMQIDDLKFTPATYTSIFPFTRIAQAAIIDFANYSFDEFRSLDASDKKFIMDTSYPLMNCLDKTYRVCHYFPEGKEVAMPGYTTYLRNSEIEKFLADCTDDIDRVNLTREIKRSLDRRVRNVREFYETFELTDIEFLALFSISLWNEKVMERDEKMQKIGSGIRAEIMNELHCYYLARGTVEYAARVGNIFCLLENCQKESDKMVEDFRICRLLGMYDSIFRDRSIDRE